MASTARISDFALIVGHLWLCPDCRGAFIDNPHAILAGMKLTPRETEILQDLAQTPDSLPERLSADTGLDAPSFQQAIAHPRARLRHLGLRRNAPRHHRVG